MNINLLVCCLNLESDIIAPSQRQSLQVAGKNPMQFGKQRAIAVWRNHI